MTLLPATTGEVEQAASSDGEKETRQVLASVLAPLQNSSHLGNSVEPWLCLYSCSHFYGAASKSEARGCSSEQDRCGPHPPGAWFLCHPGLVVKAWAGHALSRAHPRMLGVQADYRVLAAGPVLDNRLEAAFYVRGPSAFRAGPPFAAPAASPPPLWQSLPCCHHFQEDQAECVSTAQE